MIFTLLIITFFFTLIGGLWGLFDNMKKNWIKTVEIETDGDLFFIKYTVDKFKLYKFYPKMYDRKLYFDSYDKAISWITENKNKYGPIKNIQSIELNKIKNKL